jgi:hypothetical protein
MFLGFPQVSVSLPCEPFCLAVRLTGLLQSCCALSVNPVPEPNSAVTVFVSLAAEWQYCTVTILSVLSSTAAAS